MNILKKIREWILDEPTYSWEEEERKDDELEKRNIMDEPCRKHYWEAKSFDLCNDCGYGAKFTPTK